MYPKVLTASLKEIHKINKEVKYFKVLRSVLNKLTYTKSGGPVYLSIFSINFSPFSVTLLLYLLRVPWFTTRHNVSKSLIFFTLINESTRSQSVLYLISLHSPKVCYPVCYLYSFWQPPARKFRGLWTVLLAPEWRLPFLRDYRHYL